MHIRSLCLNIVLVYKRFENGQIASAYRVGANRPVASACNSRSCAEGLHPPLDEAILPW